MPEIDPYWHKQHDVFNLIYLPFLLGSNIYLLYEWTDFNLKLYLGLFFMYMILDSAWVWIKPKCVASPGTILFHHLTTFFGLTATLLMDEEFALLGAVGGLVEINTIFLLARRNFRDHVIFTYLFYLSWIVVRLLMGPWLLYNSLRLTITKFGILSTRDVILALLMTFVIGMLNLMNIKWTYDLLSKKSKSGEISKGL